MPGDGLLRPPLAAEAVAGLNGRFTLALTEVNGVLSVGVLRQSQELRVGLRRGTHVHAAGRRLRRVVTLNDGAGTREAAATIAAGERTELTVE